MSNGIGTKFDKVCSILDKYEHNPHKLIASCRICKRNTNISLRIL